MGWLSECGVNQGPSRPYCHKRQQNLHNPGARQWIFSLDCEADLCLIFAVEGEKCFQPNKIHKFAVIDYVHLLHIWSAITWLRIYEPFNRDVTQSITLVSLKSEGHSKTPPGAPWLGVKRFWWIPSGFSYYSGLNTMSNGTNVMILPILSIYNPIINPRQRNKYWVGLWTFWSYWETHIGTEIQVSWSFHSLHMNWSIMMVFCMSSANSDPMSTEKSRFSQLRSYLKNGGKLLSEMIGGILIICNTLGAVL